MSSKPEILLMGPYPQWDRDALDADYHVHEYWSASDKNALLETIGGQIRAIATRGELGAHAELMAKLPQLEIVACYGVGTDAIDLNFARDNNIKVTNTPDVLTGDVADMAIALALATARQIPLGDFHVRSGAWCSHNMNLVTRLYGKKIGIVGLGRIGRAVAKRLHGFDCVISYFDQTALPDLPYSFYADLTEMARDCEFLIVTMAGGEATKNLINASVLQALGKEGILINVSRGSTVNEVDLLQALESGRSHTVG